MAIQGLVVRRVVEDCKNKSHSGGSLLSNGSRISLDDYKVLARDTRRRTTSFPIAGCPWRLDG